MEKRKLSSPHLPVGLSWRMIDKTTDTLISLALDEDAVDRDVTTTSLFPHTPPRCNAFVKAKSDGVLCGGEIFLEVYRRVDPGLEVLPLKEDGAPFHRGEVLFTLSGSASSVLRGERTALNFLAHLSGVATATAELVCLAEGKLLVLDTRKTTPGMRSLEKYAVRCGGGTNHRRDLSDMVLLKENHLIFFQNLREAVLQVREKNETIPLEVEVKNLHELKEALGLPLQRILLDNFSPELLKEAVGLVQKRVPLEASGGISSETLPTVAETGVDYVSSGALTHSAKASDFSLLIEGPQP